MISVLFIFQLSSACGSIAEAYLERFGGDLFLAESAGLEPTEPNPYVIRALAEEGIHALGKKTRSVFEASARSPVFILAFVREIKRSEWEAFASTGKS